ncbi:MAG: 23S rRNA (adenine(2503)-C2)-methyltransferase, partial [Treponema sp.]|nr:23S rRNA (adenine(2503)-C2)-methyltransferase [Treponema sp.]
MDDKISITGLLPEEITEKLGISPAFRGKQIFEWIHRGADFDGMTNLPKEMREKLKETAVVQPVTVQLHRE